MNPFDAFRFEAQALLEHALQELSSRGDPPPGGSLPVPSLENPPDPDLGDLAIPCFPLAKAMRKAPTAIADELCDIVMDRLAARQDGAAGGQNWVKEARAAGPYCNLFIDRGAVTRAVLADPATTECAATGRRVLLEHTSANPNGPLHVGRARNPILGDSLARLLRAAGHDVEVQYYMDNLGRQVALLSWGHWNIPEDGLPPVAAGREGKPDHVLVRYYQAAHERMKADPAVAEDVRHLVARLEGADPEILPRVRAVYEACFAGMQASLDRLGVRFDSVKDESDIVQDGLVARVVAGLKTSSRAGVEEDGANYLDLSDLLAGQKDRFYFTRKDGTSVYATRDVAYHEWKARQVGDGMLVDVLGEDHRLQALQVGVALEALGHRRPHVVFYAFVSLPEGKMSTRANRVVFLDDLLDEAVARAEAEVRMRRGDQLSDEDARRVAEAVGIAAIRFNIARVQPEKPIKFRWEEALDFDGDSAPYVMYAYARGASLLRAAAAQGLQAAQAHDAILGPGEERLLAIVAGYPGAVREAAEHFAPHRFCSYAVRLAAAFNEYYRDHRVVGHEDPREQASRLAVVEAAHAVLGRTLDTLGIPRLDTM